MKLSPNFKKITPKKPMVIRKGDVVERCFLYEQTGQCLGPLCYWQRIGVCPIYEKLKKGNGSSSSGKKRRAK